MQDCNGLCNYKKMTDLCFVGDHPGYDGGDCCECDCDDTGNVFVSCGDEGFDCVDPNSSCVDSSGATYSLARSSSAASVGAVVTVAGLLLLPSLGMLP